MLEHGASKLAINLVSNASIHGRTHKGDMDQEVTVISDQLKNNNEFPLDWIRLDPAAHRR